MAHTDEVEAIARRVAAEAAHEAVRAAAAASLSAADIKVLVAEAVKQTLIQIGIDHSNPIEMQKDFQHLRAWRKSGQELKTKGMLALLGIFLTGFGGLLLLGLKEWFKK